MSDTDADKLAMKRELLAIDRERLKIEERLLEIQQGIPKAQSSPPDSKTRLVGLFLSAIAQYMASLPADQDATVRPKDIVEVFHMQNEKLSKPMNSVVLGRILTSILPEHCKVRGRLTGTSLYRFTHVQLRNALILNTIYTESAKLNRRAERLFHTLSGLTSDRCG